MRTLYRQRGHAAMSYVICLALAAGSTPAAFSLIGGAENPVATRTPSAPARAEAPLWHAPLHKTGKAVKARALASPPLAPAAGPAELWQGSFNIHGGTANLATGNLTLVHNVTGWKSNGVSVSFGLFFNSQSSEAGSLGSKWSHSYDWKVTGTNTAVVTQPNGRKLAFTLTNGVYTAPVGHYETFVKFADGTSAFTDTDNLKYSFSAAGQLQSISDPNQNPVTLGYTGSQLTSVSDSNGRALTLTYSGGKIASVADYESRTWAFAYTPDGRLGSVSDPAAAGPQLTTQFAYDGSGNVTSITDRNGNQWSYSYGANNTFSTYSNPVSGTGGQETEAFSGNDANGFESMDNTSATPGTPTPPNPTPDPAPATYPTDTVATSYYEDTAGNPGELGMDAQGRVTAIRNGNGHQTNYTYNAANQRTSVVIPGGATTTYSYDSRGNNTKVVKPDLTQVERTYDTLGNVTSETEGSRTETYVHDSRGNLLSETDETGVKFEYTYDARGNLATKKDSANKVWTFTYDAYNQRLRETDPLGNYTENVWSNGRIVSQRDGRGRIVNYTYDAMGRRTGNDYASGPDISIVYDAFDRPTQTIDGTGTRTYTYDSGGRKIGQTDPRGNTAAGYDSAGQLLWQTDVTGRKIDYSYDNAGNLTRVADPTSWSDYVFDASGRMTSQTTSAGVKTLYTYSNDELTSMEHRRVANGTTIVKYQIGYDASGRRNSITELPSGDVTTFTFDDADRLLTENRTGTKGYTSSYTYNSRGLRHTATRYDQGTLVHQGTYTYDDAGRLATVVDKATQKTETYTWFGDDTLASVSDGTNVRSMEYNEDGNLTKQYEKLGSSPQRLIEEHAYGFDGKRRWTKNYNQSTWTWAPCGVQCEAGELVRLQSTLAGTTWSVQSTSLVGNEEVRRGNAYNLSDTDANTATVVSATASVVDQQVIDSNGSVRASGGGLIGQISSIEFKTDSGFLFEPSTGAVSVPGRDLATLRAHKDGGGRGRNGGSRNYGKGRNGKNPKAPRGTPARPRPRVPVLKRPISPARAGVIIEAVRVGACALLYADCVATVDDFMPREQAICECHKGVKDGLKGHIPSSIAYFLICTEVGEILDNYCGM